MAQTMQVRVAAGLNLVASCAGVVFFALNLYRLILGHQVGGRKGMLFVWLAVYGFGAYFFWGRYRYFAGMGRSGPSN
jgi:hypothetical protein